MLWPVFFGFVEHKTFVEYFGITEIAVTLKPKHVQVCRSPSIPV